MRINKLDNVEVYLDDGHKYACRDIRQGENVIKYGQPIGHATRYITQQKFNRQQGGQHLPRESPCFNRKKE